MLPLEHKISVPAGNELFLMKSSGTNQAPHFVEQGSLACLMSRGCMISYGQSSGSRPDPVWLSDLAPKSLILGRPGLMHYTTNHDELLQAASEVFASIMAGVLQVHPNHVYLLSEAARAHKDLEARRTSGSIVLIPDSQRL